MPRCKNPRSRKICSTDLQKQLDSVRAQAQMGEADALALANAEVVVLHRRAKSIGRVRQGAAGARRTRRRGAKSADVFHGMPFAWHKITFPERKNETEITYHWRGDDSLRRARDFRADQMASRVCRRRSTKAAAGRKCRAAHHGANRRAAADDIASLRAAVSAPWNPRPPRRINLPPAVPSPRPSQVWWRK